MLFQLTAPPPEEYYLADYKGGNAGATTSLGGHGASQAFELGLWKGDYLPWANLNTAKLPQTVWYQFPQAIKVAKFAFSSRDSCCMEQAPLEFQFVASNDGKNWKVLQTLKTKFTKNKEEKSWIIPANVRALYQFYGIPI